MMLRHKDQQDLSMALELKQEKSTLYTIVVVVMYSKYDIVN